MSGPLRQEYQRVREQGWIPFFVHAGGAFDWPASVLMGIASRETNMGGRELRPGVFEWLTRLGDGGHGYGLMQIDGRSFPEWTKSECWREAGEGIAKGAEVLAGKRDGLRKRAGQLLAVRDSRSGETYRFRMPRFEGDALNRAAIASYNCGDWAGYHVSRGRDVDYGTTGKDYSSDVLARAEHFRRWLEADAAECAN